MVKLKTAFISMLACSLLLASGALRATGQTASDSVPTTLGLTDTVNTTNAQNENPSSKDEDGNHVPFVPILLFVLIVCMALYMYKENRKLKRAIVNLKKSTSKLNANNKTVNEKLEQLSQEATLLKRMVFTSSKVVEPQSTVLSKKETSRPNRPPMKRTAYATIKIDNGRLMINHRSITDDPAGKMFQLSIIEGRDEGTYVINPNMIREALANLNTLNDYADFKRPDKKPIGIVTSTAGIIKKEDLDWAVIKKLTIEFKY